MAVRLRNVTVDCTGDALAVGRFWGEVTGRDVIEDVHDGQPIAWLPPLQDEGGPGLLFLSVPEPKSVKNRWHLDLEPTERTRDEEVARLLGLGATQLADFREADGTGWVVMADPFGNEFCVERSGAERQA